MKEAQQAVGRRLRCLNTLTAFVLTHKDISALPNYTNVISTETNEEVISIFILLTVYILPTYIIYDLW